MNTRFAFDDIIFIKVSNINSIRPVIQEHSAIKSGICEAQSIHKLPSFIFRHDAAFAIGLFNNYDEFVFAVTAVAENLHGRIGENRIMDNDAIKGKS